MTLEEKLNNLRTKLLQVLVVEDRLREQKAALMHQIAVLEELLSREEVGDDDAAASNS